MMLGAARRALQTTRRQLSTSSDALPKIPKPPTAALAKRSQLLRDVRDQRPFFDEVLPRRRRGELFLFFRRTGRSYLSYLYSCADVFNR